MDVREAAPREYVGRTPAGRFHHVPIGIVLHGCTEHKGDIAGVHRVVPRNRPPRIYWRQDTVGDGGTDAPPVQSLGQAAGPCRHLLLDEPTAGLDPEAASTVKEIVSCPLNN